MSLCAPVVKDNQPHASLDAHNSFVALLVGIPNGSQVVSSQHCALGRSKKEYDLQHLGYNTA